MTTYDSKLNLFQRIRNVQLAVGYVQKTVGTGAGTSRGVGRDDVVAKVRKVLLDNGVIATSSQTTTGVTSVDGKKTRFVAGYTTTFVNVDVPTEQLSVFHEAHGDDFGDKAPGKASTYGEKLNLVKGLMLETGIDDEGRNPGEGDDSGADDNRKESTGSIKPPKAKPVAKESAEHTAGAGDQTPASAGLIKMFRAAAEAKGLLDKVDAAIEKRGDAVTKDWVATQMKRLADAPEREPGSGG